eukprot:SRR837773.5764.p1 GENE.SRR837773.5764~~SRR837773.5764.p1  ORF type:complete len:342 (+),score=81.47 SRR837773.5764:462-1487(+)
MSVRSFARMGSALSLFGLTRLGSSFSVLDSSALGSSLSLRSCGRLGSGLSLFGRIRLGSSLSQLDFGHLGSSMSLRSLARFGSSLSVFKCARFGSSFSVLDIGHLGSSLSLRSFARFGSSLSIFGAARFGSSLSVLDFVQLGSSLSVGTIMSNTMKYAKTDTYAQFASSKIEFYVSNTRSLQVTSTGGTLHGAWSSDATVTTSDRRLKKNIEPLYRTIAQQAVQRGGSQQSQQPVNWLLRELRPVSFNLKHGPEAKYLKFGFIAQELETVFPNLVRTVENTDTKAVASQDLIAVLTLALQTLQKDFDDARRELEEQRERLARLERAVFAQQQLQQHQQVHV